jgi:hypothetical protein
MQAPTPNRVRFGDQLRSKASDGIEQAEAARRARIAETAAELTRDWIEELSDKASYKASEIAAERDKGWTVEVKKRIDVINVAEPTTRESDIREAHFRAAQNTAQYFSDEGLDAEFRSHNDTTRADRGEVLAYKVTVDWHQPKQQVVLSEEGMHPPQPGEPGLLRRILSH